MLDAKGKMIRAYLSASFKAPASTSVKVPWNAVAENNFNDDYENYLKLVDGDIHIMSDNITTVLVTISYSTQPFDGLSYAYICKNGIQYNADFGVNNIRTSTLALQVKKGDYISSNVFFAGFDGTVDSWASASYMQITVI